MRPETSLRSTRRQSPTIFRAIVLCLLLSLILMVVSVARRQKGQMLPHVEDNDTPSSPITSSLMSKAEGYASSANPTSAIHMISPPPQTTTTLDCEVVASHEHMASYSFKLPSGLAKAVLVVLHGCSHDGADWCRLPEEMRIVNMALDAQFAVFAPSSKDKSSHCWSNSWPIKRNIDVMQVEQAYQHWLQLHSKLGNLPIFGIGASSGGNFVSLLAHALPLRVIVVQIAYGHGEAMRYLPKGLAHVVFAYMPRDKNAQPTILKRERMVQDQFRNVTLAQYRPRVASERYFADHIVGINMATSRLLHDKMRLYLDGGEFLRNDPRRESRLLPELVAVVPADIRKQFPKDTLKEALREELNVMYARHELSAEHFGNFLQLMREKLHDGYMGPETYGPV